MIQELKKFADFNRTIRALYESIDISNQVQDDGAPYPPPEASDEGMKIEFRYVLLMTYFLRLVIGCILTTSQRCVLHLPPEGRPCSEVAVLHHPTWSALRYCRRERLWKGRSQRLCS